jgi:hypothetical protein
MLTFFSLYLHRFLENIPPATGSMAVRIEAAGDSIAFGQAARAFVCSSIQDQTIDFSKKIIQEINIAV